MIYTPEHRAHFIVEKPDKTKEELIKSPVDTILFDPVYYYRVDDKITLQTFDEKGEALYKEFIVSRVEHKLMDCITGYEQWVTFYVKEL